MCQNVSFLFLNVFTLYYDHSIIGNTVLGKKELENKVPSKTKCKLNQDVRLGLRGNGGL